MATIKDVAREAGVSVATVSRVINESPKASQSSVTVVKQAMKKLGYRPNAAARALVSQSTNIIGVLVNDVSDPFFGMLVKAVDKIAHQNNKQVLIGHGYHQAEQERRAMELLINSRCDALVIHAKALSDQELIDYAREMKGMVLINRHIPAIAERCVSLDNFKGAYIATEHLIKNGHRYIACISSSHRIEDTAQRIAGYQAALKDHGIELPSAYIEQAKPDTEGGKIAMTCLLHKSLDMTAVVAYNDTMAAGAISVLEENEIPSPERISIVGFDDNFIARYVRPKLTTILYPIEMMGEKAAQLALKLSKKDESPDSNPLPLRYSPTLVQRDSVQKLKTEIDI
jgi:LacI family transcriptional regulator